MATITGYTAARMAEIENASIVDGYIDGDDLILVRYDGGTINAGNVRGLVGPQNPDGNPSGTILMGGWDVAPTGYLMMGQTIVGGATTQATLAGIYPNWVSGADLVIPDFTGAVPMGDAASSGIISGSMQHTITNINQVPRHNHTGPDHRHSGPNHRHSINGHGHPGSTNGTAPDHDHTLPLVGAAATASYVFHASSYVSGTYYFTVWSGGTAPAGATEVQLGRWYNSLRSVQADGGHGHTPTIANSGTLYSNYDGTGWTGYGGTGVTGYAGNLSPEPIDHTPRNFGVKFIVKT